MNVIIWADGTWCYDDELSEMTHMSDDYETHHVPEDFTEYEIECLVTERMKLWPTKKRIA